MYSGGVVCFYSVIDMFTCCNNSKSKTTSLVKILAGDGYSGSINKSTSQSCV